MRLGSWWTHSSVFESMYLRMNPLRDIYRLQYTYRMTNIRNILCTHKTLLFNVYILFSDICVCVRILHVYKITAVTGCLRQSFVTA